MLVASRSKRLACTDTNLSSS